MYFFKSINKKLESVQPLFFYSFFILLLIGSFFSTLIPPFQSPDEQDHLKRAYLLSKGRITMVTPDGQSTGGFIDSGLNNYMTQYLYIAGNQQKKLAADVKKNATSIKWSGEEEFGQCPGVNYYFPLIYLPQAFGLGIGQILDLTVSQSYYLARYSALISSLIIILFAFYIHRPSPFTVAMLLMPLAVFQFIATSQDGFAIALLVLSGSIFLRITSFRNESNTALFWCMCISILLLTTSRINLAPMLLMPFIAAYITFKRVKYYLISAGVVLLSVLWILYALSTTVDNRVETGASTEEILLFYLKNPLDFLSVLVNTLTDTQVLNFYVGSFIGILGWLDTGIGAQYISVVFYCLLIILILSVSYKSFKEEGLQRFSLIFISLSSALLVFFLLLLTWNKHPAEMIQGVQGRYFWAPIILLGLALTTDFSRLPVVKKIIIGGSLLCILIVSVLVTPNVLLSRYFLQLKQPPVIAPIELLERNTVIEYKDSNDFVENGGFIDSSEYRSGEIIMIGWGFFNTDEKLFLSNKEEVSVAKYLTIERPDVVNAMLEDTFIYSGFELRVAVESEQQANIIMNGFCLYSSQQPYGIKKLISGERNKLYKCEKN